MAFSQIKRWKEIICDAAHDTAALSAAGCGSSCAEGEAELLASYPHNQKQSLRLQTLRRAAVTLLSRRRATANDIIKLHGPKLVPVLGLLDALPQVGTTKIKQEVHAAGKINQEQE